MNGDESSEESSSSCCSKLHGLSRVWRIEAVFVNRSDVEQLIEIMPFITAPHWIWVSGGVGEVFDAEVTESLLRSIPTTHKLEILALCYINVTSSAVEFIDSLFKKVPNLKWLDMSGNPLLGAGVDSLIKHLSCAPHLKELQLSNVKMTPQQVMDLSSVIKQHGNITQLWSDYHEFNGDLRPEHEWQSDDYWKPCFARLFPDSSSELQDDLEQLGHRKKILAETHPSVHCSSFLAHDPNTVGTFPVPPNPAAEAPTLAEHGSSHGQTSFSGYLPPHVDPQHHSSPDIHTRDHNTPSVIFTPERSWRYPYPSGSGLSTVTQGGSHLECLFVNKDDLSAESDDGDVEILEETHPSVHGSPFLAHDPDTVGTFSVPADSAAGLVLAEAPTLAEHGSSHGQTSFSGYLPPHVDPQHHSSPDIHTHHHNTPPTIFSPEWSWRYPYLGGSGLSTVTQGESHLECLSVNETAAALQRNTRPSTHDSPLPVYGQETVRPIPLPHYRAGEPVLAGARNLVGYELSTDTLKSRIPELRSSCGTPSPSQLGLQPQSTIRCDPHHSQFSGPLPSSVTDLPVIPGRFSRNGIPILPLHETQPQSAILGDPQRSAPVSSSVIQPSVIQFPSDGTQRPPLHGTQRQSVIQVNPQRSDPTTSSVTQPSVIRFPLYGTLRPQLHGTQRQSVIRGDSHLTGHATSSVTHPSVIPGSFSPDGTQSSHPPSSQSRSPFMSGHDQSADDKTERRP